MAMNNNKSIHLNRISLLLLLFTLGAYLLQPIWDTDFWWHIAAGKWIVASGAIPNTVFSPILILSVWIRFCMVNGWARFYSISSITARA